MKNRKPSLNNDLIAKNVAQLKFNQAQRNFIFYLGYFKDAKSIWGRGVGKSTIMGWQMHLINRTMPRSCWVLQGASFQQILTRTLPGTIDFLVKIGYKKDVDFFINTFPFRDYALPFNSPLKPDHCLFLVNHKLKTSVAFTFFSQDRSSSRGPSRDGIMCDESLLLDIDKFNEEAKATNRGNDEYFGKHPMHHGIYHFSSMPKGHSFLTAGAKYYDEIGLAKNWQLRKQQVELELEFVRNRSIKDRIELYAEIYNVTSKIRFKPHKGQYYSEYSAFANLANLKPRYFDDLYSDNSELLFRIEVLNERITQIEDSFYPSLSREIHGYKGDYDYSFLDNLEISENISDKEMDSRQDLDCISDKPLLLGLDFGTAINWFIIAQESRTEIGQLHIKFIKNIFLKSPNSIDDVAREFCRYYRHHEKKLVYLYPDGEGNQRRPNTKGQLSYVDQIERILRDEGWTVVVDKIAKYNPANNETYILWDRMLSQKNTRYPKISINLINCKELIYSMEQTPAIDSGTNQIKKDKRSEKKLKHNREEATDPGDAADQIIRNRYGEYLLANGSENFIMIKS